METDSSQSLVVTGRETTSPSPNNLYQYQDTYLGSLDVFGSMEEAWLPTVCSIAGPRTEQLLERWTSLPDFDRRLRDAERKARSHKHENQQATVESDSEEEGRPRYVRSDSAQPLFMDTSTLPLPVPGSKFGPSAPMSPAASPSASRTTFEAPVSPRTSTGSLPVEAAAAVEAKEEDADLDLEIPWSLRTRKYEWRYIDGKVVGSNTDLPPSAAYNERQNWTEIMASWVCKEAIQEAGYKVTQVQKERKDGRRTKFDTCFCIGQLLKFDQVKSLVERTVEFYRKNVPATPSPPPHRVRRTSFDRPPPGPPPSYLAKMAAQDRDRTPTASRPQLPIERSSSTLAYPPPPPPLDRSMSMPGGAFPPPPYPPSVNSRVSNPPLTMPMPMPNGQHPSLPPQGPYPPQMPPNAQQYPYPPSVSPYNNLPLPPHMQPYANPANPHSPLRQSYLSPRTMDRYDDDSATSDSGSGERRRRRSKSRRRYEKEDLGKKKKYGKSAAVGTLMGIGGLTALLDGLGGL